ncbi:D-glycero-beta-D-manno-heptose 1,7-bisphosphate 7-phosphatase [Thiomicrorhabdus sp.]|uniref:D-glycero-beta-D-manno-heptose 1,7-bisphosphate 7-phosphatase n=1 Tax=Thiomicrorhabdus sp. TaxID=2039724 RepID=UPI0029C8B6FF|nr:D-glycero-beta-D-manno-heptose 1,7-bisphosphate 7-phosphatase [Thiomicrorhabdus sp.]
MIPALFLDRDGVINVEKNYLYRIEDFEFIDGVFEVCRAFQSEGYLIVVVTNQAGIDRGYYSEADFETLTKWMLQRFSDEGIAISKVYHCPHHPDFSGDCSCRKPMPGMLLRAAQELNIDLGKSIMVGDKGSDMLAAKNAGIEKRVLVRSGHNIHLSDEELATSVIDSIADLRVESPLIL